MSKKGRTSTWTSRAIVAPVLTACASNAPASPTLTCTQTMDSYRATASPRCARPIDPTDVDTSFCKATSPGTIFGTYGCPNGRILVGVGWQFWESDATTHQLVTIVDRMTRACVAGPASYTGATERCYSGLVANGRAAEITIASENGSLASRIPESVGVLVRHAAPPGEDVHRTRT